ncbi:hypothetical protein [Mesorhizobium sp.]|uniref:hypothetical protein n=1 Tax=Mesorhizobium sp. TaxID=1871066 RepID=UPI0025811350|nr:hypothetical protein [Mesorhizobium sp.]
MSWFNSKLQGARGPLWVLRHLGDNPLRCAITDHDLLGLEGFGRSLRRTDDVVVEAKTDKIDASVLAQIHASGLLPTSGFPMSGLSGFAL